MQPVPVIPDSAPFTEAQRSWLNGFLAGMLSRSGPQDQGSQPVHDDKKPLLIAFGSQSGNAESLAKRLVKEAAGRGFAARAAGLDSLRAADLAKERHLMLITSTWGEGEMPDNAADFWSQLNNNGNSPSLVGLRYSVLALGDRNYADTFCLAGQLIDKRLAELGAERITDRVDCDVDFDEPAHHWSISAFAALSGKTISPSAKPPEEVGYSKKNPFPASLIANIALNLTGSAKDTRHIALSLENSGLTYEVGDALGIYAKNDPAVVDQIIANHGFDQEALVSFPDGRQGPLRTALLEHYDCRKYLGVNPATPTVLSEWLEGLRKLQPRLYSIASSLAAHPNEVHLCVGAVRYTADDITHQGVASTFLADRLQLGETTGVFVHKAAHFRLPEDPSTPIIMVGPGTGIAPFRAFLEERQVRGAGGKNWLFFGDQHRHCDYLYADQIEAWHNDGFLTRLSVAFSRDQAEKIYVQTRMIEEGAEIWAWLESGAYFYVCGDASRMAKDVDTALHQIVQVHGNRTPDEAADYIAEMKKARRYARDVY